ncbi:MAG: AAA family ATPase [Promethearchaeota archaeon]
MKKNSQVSETIAIIGAQCVGKTQLSTKLSNYLRTNGINVGMIGEVARDCPDPINEDASVEAQDWILDHQIQKEMELKPRHHVIITDRGVIDNFVYWKRAAVKSNLEENVIKQKEQEIFDYSQSYSLFFFIQPFEIEEIEDDNFRSIDPEWRNEMHESISQILIKFQNLYDVPVFTLSGSEKEVFKQAKKILKDHLSV